MVRQEQPIRVFSKATDRPMWTSRIILQAIGGLSADRFAATLMGSDARCRFRDQELVTATLRFTTRETHEGETQDVQVTDIVKLTRAFS